MHIRFAPIADIAIVKCDLGGWDRRLLFIHGGQSPDATPQRSAIVVAVFILFVVVVIVVCAKPVVAS